MKRILLDTNAYSALLRGDEAVLGVMGAADDVYVSVIVIGELLAGFRGGSRRHENAETLRRFLGRPTVTTLNVTTETAEVFGELKHTLTKAGTPMPINDMWVAAQALDKGAVLVTYDGHFDRVAGLRVWPGR